MFNVPVLNSSAPAFVTAVQVRTAHTLTQQHTSLLYMAPSCHMHAFVYVAYVACGAYVAQYVACGAVHVQMVVEVC